MKTWNQLLVRHGWLLEEVEANKFDCTKETDENLDFLRRCLVEAGVHFLLDGKELIIVDEPVKEEKWLTVCDFEFRGRNETIWHSSKVDRPFIEELDTYMAGVVRQLNRLGFFTTLSCDGHGKRAPKLCFQKEINIELLIDLLRVLGVSRVDVHNNRTHYLMFLHIKRAELLDLAEQLSFIQEDWLVKGVQFIEEQLFYNELETLLAIPGVSGEEAVIRKFVKEKLTPYVDFITEDHYGNLLAEKIYGNGNGPTILLNAHLDTVFDFVPGRTIVKNGSIWTSSEGILGADDRAGVAIVLAMAKHLNASNFKGRVKFIFTVEEEVGLVGASYVDDYFLWGVDAAIVLDRRGKGDIVTSCMGSFSFCSEEYGAFFERVAAEIGLEGWACLEGGSSDTRIWASHGIESVNLSVGYGNEHRESEYVDVHASFNTYRLVKGVFERGNALRRVLRGIKKMKRAE